MCMCYFVSDSTLHARVLCSIVTWWGGLGGIEAWSSGPLLPSVLWHCCWVIWPVKPVPDMTYNVFSGTLNPTQSINQSIKLTIYRVRLHLRVAVGIGQNWRPAGWIDRCDASVGVYSQSAISIHNTPTHMVNWPLHVGHSSIAWIL